MPNGVGSILIMYAILIDLFEKMDILFCHHFDDKTNTFGVKPNLSFS